MGPGSPPDRSGPVERFADVVAPWRDTVALDQAAVLIAACAHPGLDVDRSLGELDALADGLTPGDLPGVLRRLYIECGFAGNAVEYYDPRNSFLDDVLERRTGIPISLAVVAIEVARRADVPLVGIGMPAHFLVRSAGDPNVFVDPFDGVVLDPDGCRRLFLRVAGTAAAFDPAFLAPVSERTMLSRMLANLKSIYGSARDVVNLAWVLRLRLALPGTSADERLELSRVLAAAGRPGDAADEMLAVASSLGDGDELRADDLEREALRLRARMN